MKYWNELRTGLVVARRGTVSAAATELGVHRATVNRHVEILEEALGAKLFQRTSKGYILTDEGREMLEVAKQADEMFSGLEGRTRNRERLSGKLKLNTVDGISCLLTPAIKIMSDEHPEVEIELLADTKLTRLEFGEADIAFRVGPKPDMLDYVVLRFETIRFGLYASKEYIARNGRPVNGSFAGYKFVGPVGDLSKRPYGPWLCEHVSPEDMALNTSSRVCIHEAIRSGIGMGFMADYDARKHDDLVEILPPSDDISVQIWIVTHVELHRTAKIQAFLNAVRGSIEPKLRAC